MIIARGKMKMNPNPMNPKFKDILPYQSNEESQCSGTDDVVKCFHAGMLKVHLPGGAIHKAPYLFLP